MTADWILQSSIVALAILASVHALRGQPAALREALVLVALAKFAVPPALLPFGSIFDALALRSAEPATGGVFSAGGTSAPVLTADPLFWLAALYLAGAVTVMAVAIGGQRRLLRTLRSAANVKASIGSRGHITLQRSDRIAAPIALGVFRRRIVVTPPEQAERARPGFAHSSHLIVEGAGHESTLIEDVADAIAAFFRGETIVSRTLKGAALRFDVLQ